MGENYYNKDYNISPKVREMIEKRMGKIYDLSYVQVENVINNIFKGEINTEKKYTDNDKEKLISMLSETSPNRMNDDNINNVVKFCKVSFNNDEFKRYVDYCIRKYYRPGMVYNGIKIYNGGVIKVAKDSNLYNVRQGVILNKTDVNDLLPLFDNDETKINYDEKTLIVTDDYSEHIKSTFDEIKLNKNIEYLDTDEIFVVACNDEESVTYLKDKYGYKIVDILDFSYYEEKEEEMDEMELAPGIVMKGNFNKIGNIGGTEVIGVGASSGNSLLDQLAKEDAMEKLNKIFGNSNDEDED